MSQEELWNRLYSGNQTTWRGNTSIPIPNKGKALDLGCGNGKTTSTLIDNGYDVTGVDFSSVAVEQCRERFKDSEFRVCSITDMPFDDRSFDYIAAVHVMEHLNDEELSSTVGEIRRVLKDGGYVFVRSFTPNDMRSKKREDSDIFYRFYDESMIRDAFRDFTIESLETREEPTRFGTVRTRVEALMKFNI